MATSTDKKLLTLCIPGPDGKEQRIICDSVRLCAVDGEKGRGGGGFGIRPGHAKAIAALDRHTLRAMLDGAVVYEAEIPGGIASVCGDVVTVLPE